MSDYLDLKIDVFDEYDQMVSVLKTITVMELINEITGEFEELDLNELQGYALYLEGTNQALNKTRNLESQGVQQGDKLIFSWARDPNRNNRNTLSIDASYSLVEETSQVIFPIEWQPAVIGRPDSDEDHNELLAINLQWLPDGRRISRRHAQVIEKKGVLYIERLSSDNPIYLNGKEIKSGDRKKLKINDTVRLGYTDIRLKLIKS